MGLAILKPKELRREYSAFIQEPKKVTYYTKQFDKMKEKNSKFSFNIWGLLFNIYWCFYRKMLGLGCIAFLLHLGGLYLSFAYGMTWVFQVISVALSLFFGCFGNYCYMRYVEKSIDHGVELEAPLKEKYYKENGGDGAKVVLCMIIVSLVLLFAMAASFGMPAAMTPPAPTA